MHDDIFEHSHITDEEREELAQSIWQQETLEMKTVGIDIGSSTSHLLFAKILLQRQTQGLSSRFVVTNREVIWRSPIMLTPFLPDGTIDAGQLGKFIQKSYEQAGFGRADIDSGAVILTGEAIKRKNAKAIDELFAEEAGKFVCATAGHKLESTLAAHGSGAVKLSKQRNEPILHVDIGGGTTKLALIDKGKILGVCAFAVGGRLVAQDTTGAWTRIDESARLVAQDLGLEATPDSMANPEIRRQIARRLASVVMDYILGAPLDSLGTGLRLTELLPRSVAPVAMSFSGGVSEYLFGRENKEYGDIARLLAEELRQQFATRMTVPAIDPGQGIRATVIGASQYTVQVSGKTIYLPDPKVLPIYGVPVVRLRADLSGAIDSHRLGHAIEHAIKRMDLTPDSRMAIAFAWQGDPEHQRLEAVARAIAHALSSKSNGHREHPLLLMVDGDVGKTLGHILHDELAFPGEFIAIDGVQLQEFDFVDVGELFDPPGVVPIVIKSLLFS